MGDDRQTGGFAVQPVNQKGPASGPQENFGLAQQ
jgi:hypothetical protein